MKAFQVPPKFEAEILRKAAKTLLRIALIIEAQGDILGAMRLRRRAKEFAEQANLRTN